MENKKTSELLDLLWELDNAPDEKQDWDKYAEAYNELLKRTPYNKILGESEYASEPTLEESVAEHHGDIKQLKRHKHDPLNGDVLIRI
jgi:hypothetical protein